MKPINVLSCFDGISCGQIALERAGIPVNRYFSSEIDKYAIQITQANYPDTIQIGSVTDIKAGDLPKIDLLMGGSPCQGFSIAGKQLNFDDPRSKLFFEFIRLLEELKPKWFLLENVKMKKEWCKIISSFVKVEHIEINSNLVSAQNRKRFYWSNIPGISQPKNENLYFNDWLYRRGHGFVKNEIKFFNKYPTLVAQNPAFTYKIITDYKKAKKIKWEVLKKDKTANRGATPEECECFQTLPIGYTKGLSNNIRYNLIGNGWTVDVIVHILKNLKDLMLRNL